MPAQRGETERAALLGLCRASPDAFIEFAADYVQGDLHINLQLGISQHLSTYFEFPRNHGKTDQVIYRCAWEIGHDPNILIKVVKANDTEAVDFVMAVRDILESERFRAVFPETRPDQRVWGKQALRVMRNLVSKDATIRASGIFGNPGGRADLLIFDDICTLKNAVQNQAQREQVKQAYRETWLPFLKEGGRVVRICTPWHIDDITSEWRRTQDGSIKVFRRACQGTKVSPWPEMWSSDRLAWMKGLMGPIAYSRAFELKPLTGEELVFPPEVLEAGFWPMEHQPKEGTVIATVDLAFRTTNQPWRTKKTDPDWSVILVSRLTPDGHAYPLRLVRERMTFPRMKAHLKELVHQHNIQYVVAEDVGALIELNRQLGEGLGCAMRTVTRTKDKHTRAIEVQKLVFQQRFNIPCDSDGHVLDEFAPLFEEMTSFPFSDHDDTVDCAVDTMNCCHIETKPKGPQRCDMYLVKDVMKYGISDTTELLGDQEELDEPTYSSYF